MRGVVTSIAFALCLPLIVGCGGDGGTGPQGDPEGFSVIYRRGQQIGTNGCRSNEPVHLCDIWFDWWSQDAVDSVAFFCPLYTSMWTVDSCGYDFDVYPPAFPANQEGKHWKEFIDDLGMCREEPSEVACFGFQPDSLVRAHVYYEDGSDSLFETFAELSDLTP